MYISQLMARSAFSVILLLFIVLIDFVAARDFKNSCQGGTYASALTQCDDGGVQQMSAGGNVTIQVNYALNLPNRDNTGPASKVSDPYVKFKVGSVVAVSKHIRNNLNPVWNENVTVGFVTSATEIIVEVWDKDGGLEFTDDLLISSSVRVPFCSTFNASTSTVDCGHPFGCSADDSMWAMPERQICHYTGFVTLPDPYVLSIDFFIVPMVVEVDKTYDNELTNTPILSVASKTSNRQSAKWTVGFGTPWFNGISYTLQTSPLQLLDIYGALMLRMDHADRGSGDPEAVQFYASVNFPSDVYLCRYSADNARGVPNWIQNGYDSSKLLANSLPLSQGDNTQHLSCYTKHVTGTVKNKYGGILSGALPFYTNTVANVFTYTYNYVVLFVPHSVSVPRDVLTIFFDSLSFMGFLASYGFIWFYFVFILGNFLNKIDYRLDRISPYLASRVLTGESRNILAGLFVTYQQSPCNMEYRAHLFHARNGVYLAIALPFLLLLGWGFSVASVVRPEAVGLAVVFGGVAALFLMFGLRLWERSCWRLSAMALSSLSLAVLFFLIFLLSIIFVDPAVTKFNSPINFTALSLVFGTINCVPLLLLTFKQDRKQSSKIMGIFLKISEAVNLLQAQLNADKKGNQKPKVMDASKDLKVNKLLHGLLGDMYTVNPSVPAFQFCPVLQEIPEDVIAAAVKPHQEVEVPTASVLEAGGGKSGKLMQQKKEEEEDDEEEKPTPYKEEHQLYFMSLGALLVYFIIAAARTPYASLAFLHCLALIMLDGIHLSISHGDIDWTSGFKIALLIGGRVLIMGSPSSIWLLNYSACYMLYGIILAQEMINTFLPTISARQAGEIAFAGLDHDKKPSDDLAGTAYFALAFITAGYCAVLILCAFRSAEGQLPIPYLTVLGLTGWSVNAFGLLALLMTVIISMLSATVRALYLQQNGLLKGWARDSFMIRPEIDVPLTIALFTEISILATGIIMYAATTSAAFLIGCIFLPVIFLLLGHAGQVWVRNDYDLVVWPPVKEGTDKDPQLKDGKASDLEAAFDMIDNFLGGEEDPLVGEDRVQSPYIDHTLQLTNVDDGGEEGGNPETVVAVTEEPKAPVVEKTLKGFKLPPMKITGNKVDSDIKMPPLPLKSVLRRKRQTLGIKTRLPIVNDLRVRDDAVDADKFGNVGEVMDSADPWAQFEREAEEEARERRKKKKVKMAGSQNAYLARGKSLYRKIKKSKVMVWLSGLYQKITGYLKRTAKIYPSIYKPTHTDEDDDELDLDVEKGDKSPTVKIDDTPHVEEFDEDRVLTKADIALLPYNKAFYGGYLRREDYIALGCWYGGMWMIMFFGITLSSCVSPSWLGLVIWVALWMFILTAVPLIKYFNTYTYDDSMKSTVKFVCVFQFLFCVCFFATKLNGDVGRVGALWILDFFLYYPVFLYILFVAYKWYDMDFKIPKDTDGDGQISLIEHLRYYAFLPMFAFVVMFIWQLYVWINYLSGTVATLLCIAFVIVTYLLKDWSLNDFYLSPVSTMLSRMALQLTLFITGCIVMFSDTNPILVGSVFFFVLALQQGMKVAARFIDNDDDLVFYFSPVVFPVYSYDSKTHDIVDESKVVKDFFFAMLLGVMWGSFVAIFFHPINIGMALACGFLLAIASAGAFAVSYIPSKLAKSAGFLTVEGVVEAADAAKSRFLERRLPVSFQLDEWDGEAIPDGSESKKTSLDKLKERTTLSLALELISDLRSMKYVKEEVIQVDAPDLGDVDEYELLWYQQYYVDFRAFLKKMVDMIPINKKTGWKRHNQGVLTWPDALMEAFITGRGPLGVVGVQGVIYNRLMMLKDHKQYGKYYPTFLDNYDAAGNYLKTVQLSENLDAMGLMKNEIEYDKAIDFTFQEESRCAVHFILMILVGCDAKMQREQVLFQKFLRENRFRLAANNISPPANIFSSSSFASINIPLVAVWLSTLTPDERERFHTLKQTFSDEQKERDELVDNSDYQIQFEAQQLLSERAARDKEMADKMYMDVLKWKEMRVQEFADSLEGYERQKFINRRDLWTTDLHCYVDLKDVDLYDRFKAACLGNVNENMSCVQHELIEIEAAQKDSRMGEYGRAYQFIDSEFVPGDSSVGHGACSSYVLGWRCAPGISDTAQLFDGGTHPDEVCVGVFKDYWLLSAINMLVAAGEVGGGYINDQIRELFVQHSSGDGEMTLHTEVGAYCIQLFKNNEWFPVIVDDLLPMRRKDHWTNENRGMACAHNRECNGLWISLIEKAFAKYLGSYSYLEKGYVHHALQDLTGCEALCLPLSAASRGIGKRALWDSLLRYKKNGYILGAGTGDSKLVDKEIQDMGIVFNAAYTIYDVRSVYGHKLIKMRNPPGDHNEWRGDWSDKSPLWNKRLKHKVNHKDAQDNTFFMSFDDFCNVFRNLYVCKYYNTKKWIGVTQPGLWKKSDEAAVEALDMMNQLMENEADADAVDAEAVNRKKAKARLDSAGGLPTRHNPACVLENNPYYSLRLNRPTDFRISVTQFPTGKTTKGNFKPLPFSIIIARNAHPRIPMRLQKLDKGDILYSTGLPQREKTLNLYVDAMKPGLYIVLVAAYMSGMEGSFTISLLSNFRADFQPIWPPVWMLKGEKMPANAMTTEVKAAFASGGQKASNFFTRNMKMLIGSGMDNFDSESDLSGDEDDDEVNAKADAI